MGDNVYLGDRNGVRTPMQWSADRNAGFSESETAALYSPVIADPPYSYHSVNVVAQERTPTSLLRWMRRLVSVRKKFRAFGRGTFEALDPNNRRVFVFIRRYRDEVILCVNNLSRFAQYVELNLAEFRGCVPLELWGEIPFPPVGDLPYLLTLGPHNFYWFRLVSGDQVQRA
jgi:maltose alpha-D-glucosyltransferase/alpha-amylase